MKRLTYVLVATSLWACQTSPNETVSALSYPQTKKVDTVDVYFDNEVPDPYRWLEDDRSDETANWVSSQNKITSAYLENISYRDKLKERLRKLFDYERVFAPKRNGDYDYLYKNDGLQNQNVLYRSQNDEPEEIFLNPNDFSENGTISLTATSFTDDGFLCAYMISIGGSDWRKAIVMNTQTMEITGDTLDNIKFSGLSWRGNEGFYYSSYDKPKDGSALSGKTQYHKLYYHQMGTSQDQDKLIFGGEKQPYRYIGGHVTEDNRYLVINAATGTSGNVLFVQDFQNSGSIVPVDENMETDESILHTDGDRLLIQTNLDVPNQKIVETTISDPGTNTWKDVIPETENVLNDANTGGGFIFANYLIDAKTEIRQFDLNGKLIRDIELPALLNMYR